MSENDLDFKGNNPGASKYGNFINYYQFHPPEERIKLLPQDLWSRRNAFYGLDVGCNAGELTGLLQKFLTENVSDKSYILGIDIDPTLIKRASETKQSDSLQFNCIDIMNDCQSAAVVDCYLKDKGIVKFDTVFCFSVTMWIHLNQGDEGLVSFLRKVAGLGEVLVIEPQPWKCYKSAEKRMKLSGYVFPHFKNLKIRSNIEGEIERILTGECGCFKIGESGRTKWGRKLLFFKC